MKTKKNTVFDILIVVLLLGSLTGFLSNCYGENNSVRSIYFMRENKMFCGLITMKVQVNDKNIYKLNNGSRLIYRTNSTDTLKIQIIYPPMNSYKSRIVYIYPNDKFEIYLDVYYEGGDFNPLALLKNEVPEFTINIKMLNITEGDVKFNNNELYINKNIKIITVI